MKNLLSRDQERFEEFKLFLEEYCRLAGTAGISITPYQGEGPRNFFLLPVEFQEFALQYLRISVEVFQEVIQQGGSLLDDRTLIWRLFQKMRLHPPSDLMEVMPEGQVIEVYNSNFVQVFRNLRFFEICSYTLDDLLCRPLFELVSREEAITAVIFAEGSKLLSGTVAGVYRFSIPQHDISERDSAGRNKITVQFTIGAPLWSQEGAPAALINFFSVRACVRNPAND